MLDLNSKINISEEDRLRKNEVIRTSLAKTREKRKHQECKVYQLKIDESKLNKQQKEQLKLIFIEAKRYKNWVLNQEDVFNINTKNNTIVYLNKDKKEITYQLKYLTSSLKNDVIATILSNIKTLSTLKKKKLQNPGKLKFCKEYKTLNYIQYGITHKIVDKNKIKLQGIKKALKVRGVNQLKNKEIANVRLCNTPKGYYLRVTTFVDKKDIDSTNTNKRIIGIDFGCQTSLTTSEGSKIKVEIKETDRLKKLQKSLSRKQKMSNNFNKTKKLIQIEYQNITNRKNDVSNKIVHDLLKNDVIVIQDEQLKSWHHNRCLSKSIQHSILGRVKSKLITSDKTIVVSRWCPTSKLCSNCGKIHEDLKLQDRTFKCECGIEEDRDVHAAKNMIWFYEHSVGVGRTNFKPVEIRTSIDKVFENTLETSCRSAKQEAMNL